MMTALAQHYVWLAYGDHLFEACKSVANGAAFSFGVSEVVMNVLLLLEALLSYVLPVVLLGIWLKAEISWSKGARLAYSLVLIAYVSLHLWVGARNMYSHIYLYEEALRQTGQSVERGETEAVLEALRVYWERSADRHDKRMPLLKMLRVLHNSRKQNIREAEESPGPSGANGVKTNGGRSVPQDETRSEAAPQCDVQQSPP